MTMKINLFTYILFTTRWYWNERKFTEDIALREKRRIITIIILTFTMILAMSGCSKEKAKSDDKKEETQVSESLTEDSLILKINKEEVYYNEAMIYMLMLKQEYEPSFGKEIWSFDQGDGRAFEAVAKDEIISEITQLEIICQEAEKLGITLNEDEKSEVKDAAAEHFGEITAEDAKKYGITLGDLESVYEENSLAKKVFDNITLDVDTEVSDEAAKQITVNQIYISTVSTDKDGNEITLDDEEKTKALKKAKALLKQAKEAEDFAIFAEKNTQHNQVEFTFGKGDAEDAIETAVFALKTGEISDIVKTDNGYYIFKCISDFDEDATAEKKEEIIVKRQEQAFAKTYKTWSKEFEIMLNSKVWDTVTFQ